MNQEGIESLHISYISNRHLVHRYTFKLATCIQLLFGGKRVSEE